MQPLFSINYVTFIYELNFTSRTFMYLFYLICTYFSISIVLFLIFIIINYILINGTRSSCVTVLGGWGLTACSLIGEQWWHSQTI